MLPSPESKLGNLIHKLIDQVVRGTIKDLVGFENKFDEELEGIEYLWFEKHLIPLRRNIPDFEVKRQHCLNRVKEILNEKRVTSPVGEGKFRRRNGSNVWLESQDLLIGGYIDEINQFGPVLRIIDYKSGSVYDRDKNQLKAEYTTQLKLYAALYYDNFQTWPDELIIKQVDGNEIRVPFSQDECLALFQQAKNKFYYINQLISKNTDASKLATPSPANCKYCTYRPVCNFYHQNMEDISTEWAKVDLYGTLLEREALGNGKERILLQAKNKYYYIRGVSSRHPALNERSLTNIRIYNLSRDTKSNHFMENNTTTIYIDNPQVNR